MLRAAKRASDVSLVLIAAAGLSACGQSNGNDPSNANPADLIRAGDAKACAHPAVLDVLRGLIGTPKGDEAGLILPVGLPEISKMTLPPFSVDMITLASVDMSVKRLTCRATSKMSADIGGPTQHFEKEVVYIVSPSAADDDEFVVSTDASIAADRVNIALVKQFAGGFRKAMDDTATREKLRAALSNAGAVEPMKPDAPSPGKAALTEAVSKSRTTEYDRCMQTGDAAEGVTSAMAECTDAELARQDARLNAAYRVAMSARNEAQRAALRNAQRAWIKLRDTKCQEDLSGGTMDILNVGGCHLTMTEARAAELEGMATAP